MKNPRAVEIGRAIETNFAIKKFAQLSLEEKTRIYKGLKGDKAAFIAVGLAIFQPLVRQADAKELAAYASECLSLNLKGYFVWPEDYAAKNADLAVYFRDHIKLVDGVPTLELIDTAAILKVA
jgi:hypothetical protein